LGNRRAINTAKKGCAPGLIPSKDNISPASTRRRKACTAGVVITTEKASPAVIAEGPWPIALKIARAGRFVKRSRGPSPFVQLDQARSRQAFVPKDNVELAFFWTEVDDFNMNDRETVIEFVRNLPEKMSLAEIVREIELLAGIQRARQQAHRHEGIPAEEARKLVDTWASK
jgi:hypothetical protein